MRDTARAHEELLAQGPWLRALARSLVRDAAEAEDLVQQAWVRALERPPEPGFPLRRWFAAVLRNLARQEHRSQSRREARERFAGERGPELPAESLSATLELSQRLAEAVAQLEEPYRSAIFRRYYEGLAPRRIAELDGLPPKTVKSQLARGLEKLRERLDREQHGGRGAWVAACLPLLRARGAELLLGGIAMNLKLVCVVAGLVLLAAWAVLRPGGDGPSPPPATAGSASAEAGAALEAEPQLPEGAGGARGIRSDALTVAPTSVPKPAVCPVPHTTIELSGLVVDPHGLPLADVRLFLVTPEEALELRRSEASTAACATVASSNTDGSFTIRPRVGVNILMGERAGFVTLLACDTWSTDGSKPLLVVMAPPIDVAGVVVDEAQQPIASAEVRLVAGEDVRRELGRPSDTAVEVPWRVRSDAQGRFAFEGVPGVSQAALCAAHPRHLDGSTPMPERPRPDLRIVLRGREVRLLAGEVRDVRGQPVEDALVGTGQLTIRTGADGRFELELDPSFAHTDGTLQPFESTQLCAVKPGRLPARMAKPASGWPEFVTLVLGDEPLTIHGQVLGARDEPLVGIEVHVASAHLVGMVSGSVGDYGFPRTLEGLARKSDEMETPTSTGREGEFTVRGLLDEPYVLRLFDPSTMRMFESEPVRAGSQTVVLRFPPAPGLAHLAGRVLSLAGDPLADVQLVPMRPVPGLVPGQQGYLFGPPRASDAEGRFDFGEVEADGLQFQVMGAGLQMLVDWRPPAGADLAQLELRVARRFQLQVDLGDRPELADSVVVLDARGRALELWIEVRNVSSFELAQPIRAGKSDVLLVAEDAALVVLKKDGAEVARQPVQLKPRVLETVRF